MAPAPQPSLPDHDPAIHPGQDAHGELVRLTHGLRRAMQRLGHRGRRRSQAVPQTEDPSGQAPPPQVPPSKPIAPGPILPQAQLVQGTGKSGVLFITDCPTPEAVARRQPIHGAEGELLTDIIEKGMRLSAGDVAITHLPCGSTEAGIEIHPDSKSIDLRGLLDCVRKLAPRVVITLGDRPAQVVLGSQLPLNRLRGQIHPWADSQLVATLAPESLLENPALKRDCWQDIQLAMGQLNTG